MKHLFPGTQSESMRQKPPNWQILWVKLIIDFCNGTKIGSKEGSVSGSDTDCPVEEGSAGGEDANAEVRVDGTSVGLKDMFRS